MFIDKALLKSEAAATVSVLHSLVGLAAIFR